MPDYLVEFEAVEKRLCTATVTSDTQEDAVRIITTGDGAYHIVDEKSISMKEQKECVSVKPLLTYNDMVEALHRGDVVHNYSRNEYYWLETLHIPNVGNMKVVLRLGYPHDDDIVRGVTRFNIDTLRDSPCILTIHKSKKED